MTIKVKNIRQYESFCGPASLSSLLDFYGVKLNQKEIGKLCCTTFENGTEPEALVKLVKKLKFPVKYGERGTWQMLKMLTEAGTPVLVDWWSDYEKPADGHYGVVYRVTSSRIYLMDPELGGPRIITKQRFLAHWYDFYVSGKKNTRWYMYIPK